MINFSGFDVYSTEGSIIDSSHMSGHLVIEQPYNSTSLSQLGNVYASAPSLDYSTVPQNVSGINRNPVSLELTDTWAVPSLGYEPNLSYKHLPRAPLSNILPFVELNARTVPNIVGHQYNTFGDVISMAPLGMGQTPAHIDITVSPVGISSITEQDLEPPFWYTPEFPWGFCNYALKD